MNKIDQILKIIKYSGCSASAFANKIGYNQSNLSKVINGKRDVNNNLIDAICNKFPEINRVWLLTGEGDMFDDSSLEAKKSFTSGTPYYNVDFIGGFDLVINDQTINPEYLIQFKPYEKATCWCNITGHSM